MRQFGKGFWLFTTAYCCQNACMKTFIILSIPFMVSGYEQMTKLQASSYAVSHYKIKTSSSSPS